MNSAVKWLFICLILFPLLLVSAPVDRLESLPSSLPSPTLSLSGTYDLGGGNDDFPTFAALLDTLSADGISGPTTIFVYPGTYTESLTFPPVAGSSPAAWLEFVSSHPDSTVTITSAGANNTGVITFSGASYISFHGISVTCQGDPGQRALIFENGCSNIAFGNGVIRGSGTALSTSYAVESRGSASDSLLLENLTVINAADGIHLSSSSVSGLDSKITGCVIDSVQRGVYLDHQQRLVIEQCEIQVNAGLSGEIDGVYVGTLSASDTVSVRCNRIHDLVTSNSRAVAVKIIAGSTTSLVRAYNNFIYGFANTGGSQIRALDWASGMCEIYSNSIYINDVSATGGSYCVHHNNFNPSLVAKLRNNILFNNVQSGAAYCIFIQSPTGIINSDFNIFHGTGTGYILGKCGNVDRPDLTSWQSCSGGDFQSLTGDPVFTGETDLHLAASGGLAHQNGTPISYILTDIDDDERSQPPDRGADEYGFTAPPADFAVLELSNSCAICPELSNVSVDVVAQNRGSQIQSDVPLRVYYLDNPQAQTLITLLPLETDTFSITWATGFAPSSGELRVEIILPDDQNPADNTLSTFISVLGQPLHGAYRLGGLNADFATFSAAMQALGERGISDTVTFFIASGTYNESVVIPRINGIAPDRPVQFRKSIDTEGPVKLISDAGPATMVLDSARFVTLDGISIETVEPNNVALLLQGEASYNTVCNGSLKSFSPSDISTIGARVTGGGCHGNRFDDLTVSDCYHGFKLDGSSANPDSNTVIESCVISNSVRSIFLLRQKNCEILRNTISPGFEHSTYHGYGVYIASLLAGDSTLVEGNTITGAQGDADVHGIFSAANDGMGLIYNNSIAGWNISGGGAVYGIQAGSGFSKVYHNSICMSGLPDAAGIFALSVNGSSTFMDTRNNAVEVSECGSRAFCWKYQNGTLASQNNVYYSPCEGDSFSFALFSIDSVYQTLAEWAEIRNLDTTSLFENPGFVSPADLHIQPYFSTLDGIGEFLPEVSLDIDGEPRDNPPDIGADEYNYSVPSADFSVGWFSEPASQYSALTAYQFSVEVTNLGGAAQTGVPVQLLFNDIVQDEELVSLLAGESAVIAFDWFTPEAELLGGLLSIRSLLMGDMVPANDRTDLEVIIAGAPLMGTYQIGGGTSDFASLGQAVQSLEIRGVQNPVVIELFPGDYCESISISALPGSSTLASVRIKPANDDTASVYIKASVGEAVVTLDGACYLDMEGINLVAQGSCTGALLIKTNSSHNKFSRAALLGPDSANIESFGARFEIRNCDFNSLDRVLITGAYSGVSLKAEEPGFQAYGTQIGNCVIQHARYGIYIDDQVDCVVRDNEIIPGSSSTLSAVCYGIFVTHLNSGGSVEICGNRIHGFADASGSVTNRAVGIYSSPAAGGVVTAYNNFIYDFSAVQSLKIAGIYLSVGASYIYHNSILIDESPSPNEISGILIFAGSDNDIRNNNIVSLESDVASRGIYALGGGAQSSDYNNLYGTSPLFQIGAVGTTEYPTLSEWQSTGYDLNSVSLDPHFLSAEDLHIDDSFPDFDDLGDESVPVTVDIDGQTRGNPPDIGADEFDFILIPDPPQNLTLAVADTDLILRWQPAVDAQSYHVYMGDSLNFIPDASTRITTTSDTFYVHQISEEDLKFFLIIADSNPPPE
ncbi:hypothetical protein EH220_04975 [bacterium]|nr:MAG: hypothetical protein EH220_04975 [bacterium]